MLHSCGTETQVKESRPGRDGVLIRRRRYCPYCKVKFTTYEISGEELTTLVEIKKSLARLKAYLIESLGR